MLKNRIRKKNQIQIIINRIQIIIKNIEFELKNELKPYFFRLFLYGFILNFYNVYDFSVRTRKTFSFKFCHKFIFLLKSFEFIELLREIWNISSNFFLKIWITGNCFPSTVFFRIFEKIKPWMILKTLFDLCYWI